MVYKTVDVLEGSYMKDLIGIDIGTGSIKIVSKDGYVVIETPDNAVKDGELIAFEGIGELLKNTLKENDLKGKKVALVIPDKDVFIKRIKMPYMSIKQLNVNLPYEFKDIVGNNKDDYVYDYAFISHDENEMELLGGAVEKVLLEKYTEMFKKCNLKLVKALPRQMAISDLLQSLNITKDVALVGLGYTYTRVGIYKNGYYDTSRIIESGIKDMVKIVSEILYCDDHIAREYLKSNKDDVLHNAKMIELFEDIAIKITRAVNYYIYENRDNTLDEVYVFGGGYYIDPFVETIKNTLSIDTKKIGELFNSDDEVYIDALSAFGASRG